MIRGYGTIPDRIPAASVCEAGQALRRHRPLDGGERVRGLGDPVLGQRADQLRLRDLPLDEPHGRAEAHAQRVRSGRERSRLHVALTLATGNAAALLDWNNNYGNDREQVRGQRIAATSPKASWERISRSPSSTSWASRLGRERCFGAIKGKVAPGPHDFFRMDTDDRRGRHRGYVGKVSSPRPVPHGRGNRSLSRTGVSGPCSPTSRARLRPSCCNGSLSLRGHLVHEAATRYLGWDVYRHRASKAPHETARYHETEKSISRCRPRK